ncbi:MAG: O-antigen ligase family protein [Proteobacteria bacterium]|nr:O-antigen ligase family protein [Pseudomonadota bacterium]
MQDHKLRRIALLATLLVPLGLLHAFVLAEICIAVTDVLFLAHSFRTRDFSWARQGWMKIALIWWFWLLLCSTPLPWPGFGSAGWKMGFGQAFVVIRLILFTAALQHWVLASRESRRWAGWALMLSALWIAIESWQQYLTGHNIFGDPRWADGSLTGPFWKPRAGALYTHILYPAMLPAVAALLASPRVPRYVLGLAVAVAGILTSVLIGQRMGVALTGLGLVIAAFFLPRLRLPAAIAIIVSAAFLLASPVLSPGTHAKLVGETDKNMSHFSQSPYGELYTRAMLMGVQSPWHGWGYNGFRELCPEPRFNGGIPALNIPPTQLALGACNLHPHNYYIQSFTDAGVPGLVLFVLLAFWWLKDMAAGLWRQRAPMQVALFIAVVTYLWPIGSTDEFPTLYMLGWLFFLLGLGLAMKRDNG